MYNINQATPSNLLAQKTQCKKIGLVKIMKKGQGAYYSSGSRPSQTAHSWGIARLASALTGGKASGIDLDILKTYCKPNAMPLRLAQSTKQGRKKTKKVTI